MTDKIVKFNFPSCWSDDIRMNILFAPFRTKSINPENYLSKLEFWKKLIFDYCKQEKGSPNFNKEELEKKFTRQGKIPYCLNVVIEEMKNCKLIKEQQEYLETSKTWLSWTINYLVKNILMKPLSYTLQNKSNEDSVTYILLELQKELAENLIHVLQQLPNNLFSFEDLKKEIESSIHLSDEGLNLSLFYLYLEHLVDLDYVFIGTELNISLIKVTANSVSKTNITEFDRVFQQLKETKKNLMKQLKQLELQLKICERDVREHIKDKQKNIARINLKRKHIVQKSYEKKSEALINIEALMTNLEDVEHNSDVLKSYKMGTEAIKALMYKSGLGVDKVEDVISAMKDVIEDHNEIQDSLASADIDLSDSSLNAELEELLSEDINMKSLSLENDDIVEQSNMNSKSALIEKTKENKIKIIEN